MTARDLDLETDDGVAIRARLHEPADRPRGGVLIVPAMGVPQRYYAPFAAWLAREGYAALTFDYRGIGDSRPRSLRGFPGDVLDWARLDAARALAELRRSVAEAPIDWIGHSLGGQIFPFVPGAEDVRRMLTVATGSGYWRENTPRLKRSVWFLWFVAVPLLTPLFGYFPGRRLGMIGDVPRGAIAQWRRWCLDPDYAAGVEPGARALYSAVATPITSFSFTDDEYMSETNVRRIHGLYGGAPLRFERLAPGDLGVARIGHFGAFRKELEGPLWRARILPELAA